MALNGVALKAADFERALRTKPCARTPHFLLHHVSRQESSPRRANESLTVKGQATPPLAQLTSPRNAKLSTDHVDVQVLFVDTLCGDSLQPSARVQTELTVCLGLVVPKRFAKRAVTRNLIKRQAREIWRTQAVQLSAGHWVLRLRSPFDPAMFVSAASGALKSAVRGELSTLFSSTAQRATRSSSDGLGAGRD